MGKVDCIVGRHAYEYQVSYEKRAGAVEVEIWAYGEMISRNVMFDPDRPEDDLLQEMLVGSGVFIAAHYNHEFGEQA